MKVRMNRVDENERELKKIMLQATQLAGHQRSH